MNATVVGSYDVNIPESLISLYHSGLKDHPPSVASFFDIESRQYTYTNKSDMNMGNPYPVQNFRMLEGMVLRDAIEPVEGLIVNTKSGGVGFRNHTAPTGAGLGAQWSEDILFIEPETVCVDTNLTLEFKIGPLGGDNRDIIDLALVDKGGFVNLAQEWPTMDPSTSQEEPKLRLRAYRAAVLLNFYTMLFMNVTRPAPNAFAYLKSEIGQRFPLSSSQSEFANAGSIKASTSFTGLADPGAYVSNSTPASAGTTYPNPFELQSSNYSTIPLLCKGAGSTDIANSSNIHVNCGLVFGAAVPQNKQDALLMLPYSTWEQPVYTCASVTKATIKDVEFRYDAANAGGLSGLSIVNVTDKVYADKNSMPLWGVETVNFDLFDFKQIWGLIAEDKANSPNLTTIRAPQLYLPGFHSTLVGTLTPGMVDSYYLPGHEGPSKALSEIYSISISNEAYDWSGKTNVAMFRKWQDYSLNAETVPKIFNLIWTDIAANIMMTPKSQISDKPDVQKRDTESANRSNLVPVYVSQRHIQFRWLYAIPALATLLLFGLIIFGATMFSFFGKGGPDRIRHYLFHLSAGRLLGASQHPGACDKTAPTNVWISHVGRHPSDLQRPYAAVPGGAVPFPGPYPSSPYHSPNDGAEKPGFNFSVPTNAEAIPMIPVGSDARHGQGGYVRVHSSEANLR